MLCCAAALNRFCHFYAILHPYYFVENFYCSGVGSGGGGVWGAGAHLNARDGGLAHT